MLPTQACLQEATWKKSAVSEANQGFYFSHLPSGDHDLREQSLHPDQKGRSGFLPGRPFTIIWNDPSHFGFLETAPC
jgi:hypothetical protein